MTASFPIGDRILAPGERPYVVAEIGVNHDGDLDQAKRTIDAAARAGADAAKFQTFRAEEFMADREIAYEYESNGRVVRESMYEMFKRLELPAEWHEQLQAHCRLRGVEFLSSAADSASADLLAQLNVSALKIASEDLVNRPLLEHAASLALPVILSTGMADETEIRRAVAVLQGGGCPHLLLLHCVSAYPTSDEEANLLRMVRLAETLGLPVGYSDHTIGIVAAVAATALGAVLIEKHFTLDRALPGPDHAFSADPDALAQLVQDVHRAARQRGSPELEPSAAQQAARRLFRRSVVAARDIAPGTMITRAMLCLKRPGQGIAPHLMDDLVGKCARRGYRISEPLDWDGLA